MSAGIILHAPLRALSARPAWLEPLLQALPYARRLQLTSRAEVAREASLYGLALALVAAERVAGRPFAAGHFRFPPDGRPGLASGPCFSVSHADARVAVVVSAHTQVGLDIEDCPSTVDAESRHKLERWTATEALLKVRGLGLRDLHEVALDDSLAFGTARTERFELQRITAMPDVIGHLAAPTRGDWTLEVLDLGDEVVSAALERSLGLSMQFE
jgi:phosphopantetheinyl transferase